MTDPNRQEREALEKIAHGFSWDNQEEGCLAATEMAEVAEAALAARDTERPDELVDLR